MRRNRSFSEILDLFKERLGDRQPDELVELFNEHVAVGNERISVNANDADDFILSDSLNGRVGMGVCADKLRGRTSLLEWTPNDTNDGIQWLLDTHLKDKFKGAQIEPPIEFISGPSFAKGDITAAILIGNEDAPDEVWLTNDPQPKYNSTFWRVL